jgi:lysine 2,3-aminomutase
MYTKKESLSESDRSFISHAPGRWPEATPEEWNSWHWQQKNRVTKLEELEKHLNLTPEERAGVILSAHKLAMGITPHYFNLLDANNPDCPIRRQIIPRIEETQTHRSEMADPCGEDSHMPVPGLVHRYPDRVLFFNHRPLCFLLPLLHTLARCEWCRRPRAAYQF